MNPSTASHRLVKDLLFEFAIRRCNIKCHRCMESVGREDFSVEHIKPWLDSENPRGLFFDLDNVTFSHLSCNASAAKRPERRHQIASYNKGCGCDNCKEAIES